MNEGPDLILTTLSPQRQGDSNAVSKYFVQTPWGSAYLRLACVGMLPESNRRQQGSTSIAGLGLPFSAVLVQRTSLAHFSLLFNQHSLPHHDAPTSIAGHYAAERQLQHAQRRDGRTVRSHALVPMRMLRLARSQERCPSTPCI